MVGRPAMQSTALVALSVIQPTLGLAIGSAALLLVLIGLGWRIASAAFDRESLVTAIR